MVRIQYGKNGKSIGMSDIYLGTMAIGIGTGFLTGGLSGLCNSQNVDTGALEGILQFGPVAVSSAFGSMYGVSADGERSNYLSMGSFTSGVIAGTFGGIAATVSTATGYGVGYVAGKLMNTF